MKMRTALGIIVCVISAPLPAQWLNYPTPGIPRLPDGKPNLTAPAPRTADGKPDLSGIWGLYYPVGNAPVGDFEGKPTVYCATEVAVPPVMGNIGAAAKDGVPYQPWAAELVKKTFENNRPNDPLSHCLPIGLVRLHTFALFRKILQFPGLLVTLNEFNATYRQIFTDGRALPADPNPTWNGYSSGKWEGDTLVVQTTGFRDGLWLDTRDSPLTDAARITERFQRPNYGTLEIDVTINDPKAYTKPWTLHVTQILVPDTELLDYICAENEKDTRHMPDKTK
jgi:hypothetical protein